jgi:MYXO-CTERM domain-containing protein
MSHGKDLIVGGHQAPAGTWPDIVALPFEGSSDSVYCTGTLIAPTVVLTAGHCVIEPPPPGNVLIGADSLAQPAAGELIDIAAIHEYPDSQNTEDLAVLILASPSTHAPRMIATGWAAADILDGATVTIAGYGALDRDATMYVDELQEASTVVTDRGCSTSSGCLKSAQPDGELGAGGMGTDTCPGDSGGPLYLGTSYGTFLAGVTSRGYENAKYECTEGGIYVRPGKVADWIDMVVGEKLPRPPGPSAPDLVVGRVEGVTMIVANDPSADAHRFSIATQPANGKAHVDGHGNVVACANGAGDDAVVVAVADAGNKERVAYATIKIHADAATDDCSIDDGAGCCSSSGGSSSIALAIAIVARFAFRRRRSR